MRMDAPVLLSLDSTCQTRLSFQKVPPNENYMSKVILWHSSTIYTTALLTIILKFFILSHLPSGTVSSAVKSMSIATVGFCFCCCLLTFPRAVIMNSHDGADGFNSAQKPQVHQKETLKISLFGEFNSLVFGIFKTTSYMRTVIFGSLKPMWAQSSISSITARRSLRTTNSPSLKVRGGFMNSYFQNYPN